VKFRLLPELGTKRQERFSEVFLSRVLTASGRIATVGDIMDEITPDRRKTAALTRRIGVDFGAALTVALAYIGDRLGIFKAMANGTPMTSQQLAKRTRLNERYLREWAATMAASGYLDYDPADGAFRLNPEQAMVLGACPRNSQLEM
jgi:hypothetical protein